MHKKSVLIANRGEIALRIIRTAKRLGYQTIAIYSDADINNPHVEAADLSIPLGGTSAAESYLNIEKIIRAAAISGAELIHPGYGFLSEKADFARAVKKAKLTFIGPSAETLEILGQKAVAKKLAAKVGAPNVPAVELPNFRKQTLEKAAKSLGFPLMVKATMGGGGKGMRKVPTINKLADAVSGAKREALAYFSSDELMLEKVLTNVRHIEIQIARDFHGNTYHLFERECSLQRRNQKVVEECPAINISEKVLHQLYQDAIAVTQAAHLTGIATVEFLVDEEENHYFLEVNPRIQVEHAVTEMVTGVDLVELQFLIAENAHLPEKLKSLQKDGHAIEARIYAEIPEKDFIPSSGQLLYFQLPQQSKSTRLEHALSTTTRISTAYDPMLAKIITYASSRSEAITDLNFALNQTALGGLNTNLPFLTRVVNDTQFEKNRVYTTWIDESSSITKPIIDKANFAHAALSATLAKRCEVLSKKHTQSIFSDLAHWQNSNVPRPPFVAERWRVKCLPLDIEITLNVSSLRVDKLTNSELQVEAMIDNTKRRGVLSSASDSLIGSFHFNDKIYPHCIQNSLDSWITGDQIALAFDNYFVEFSRILNDSKQTAATSNKSAQIVSPLPGTVLSLDARKGRKVNKGEVLLVIESMKMEHKICAPRNGTVKAILTKKGQTVQLGQELIVLSGR